MLLIARGLGSGSRDPGQILGKTNALDQVSHLTDWSVKGNVFTPPEDLFLKYLMFISVTECLKGTVLETLSMGSPQWCTDFSHGLDR